MKKWLLLIGILVVILGSVFWFWNSQKQRTKTPVLVYNAFSEEWEESYKAPPLSTDELNQLQPIGDGGFNQLVQRGYFDSFDQSTNSLSLKAVIPFTAESQYYLLTAQLDLNQSVYCVPEYIIDEQTGQYLPVKEITFPVKDGEILAIPGEKKITLEDFLTQSTPQTYLFVQLLDKPKTDGVNYIQKLIVLGLCN